MIDTTFDQAKKIITKDLDNWNSNFWRLRCREQVINILKHCLPQFGFHELTKRSLQENVSSRK